MKVTYDPEADAATIYLVAPRPGMSKTTIPADVGDRFFAFDFDAEDRLVAIEILDASKVLPARVLQDATRPDR